MSTIASPREPPMRRMPSSSQTPTSSSRPSLETSRSVSSSPSRNPAASASGSASGAAAAGASGLAAAAAAGGAQGGAARRNRAALREYYNLKKTTGAGGSTPVLEVTEAFEGSNGTDAFHAGILSNSEVPPSEMDAHNFDPEAYVQKTLQESGLEDLLRIYTRVLTETRALDAEKKSLVYDNYSRLITATETIRKVGQHTERAALKPCTEY